MMMVSHAVTVSATASIRRNLALVESRLIGRGKLGMAQSWWKIFFEFFLLLFSSRCRFVWFCGKIIPIKFRLIRVKMSNFKNRY